MGVTTFEGIVEKGQIRLPATIHLPDSTKVYVVIPSLEVEPTLYIGSPRLIHPEQAVDFKKEVLEESPDAGV